MATCSGQPLTKPGVLKILKTLEKDHAAGETPWVYDEEVFMWSYLKDAVRADQPRALEASAAMVEITAKRLKAQRACSGHGARVFGYILIGLVFGVTASFALMHCAATVAKRGKSPR
jgi:hypothetical protein